MSPFHLIETNGFSGKINWYDPFLEQDDELLKDFDRNNI